jgi:prepilin-type processing-associated H-X9-DG protein/prepilin-type N-terminal cleavage/methylation domain-containing protein
MKHPTVSRSRAFTLLEVCTVISVLSILAVLSFAAFGRVRESARNATCQGNLRQIYLGMQQYVQDNSGTYPTNLNGDYLFWDQLLLPYIKNPAVFDCPDVSNYTSNDYSYNGPRLLHMGGMHLGRHEAAVNSSPSTIFLNVCRDVALHETDSGSCGRSLGFNGIRHHSGGTNWSFVDGHVKWLTPGQLMEIECANPPLPTD